MKKLNRFKLFSLLLALTMLVSAIPTNIVDATNEYLTDEWFEEHFVEINQSGCFNTNSVELYQNPTEAPDNKIELSIESLPETFTVQYKFTEDDGTEWYLINTEDWSEYSEYGYVSAEDVSVFTAEGIPEGALVNISGISAAKLNAIDKSIIDYSILGNCHNTKAFGIDLKIIDSSNTEWQPEKDSSVTVKVTGVWDTGIKYPTVDVYHILDTTEAIEAAKMNGTLLTSDDSNLLKVYPKEAALASSVLNENVIAYSLLTTRSGDVVLYDDGSISFKTDSFSSFIFTSGSNNSIEITGASSGAGNGKDNGSDVNIAYNVYIVGGTSATITVPSAGNITIDTITENSNITLSDGTVNQNSTTSYILTALAGAAKGENATYKFSWETSTQSGNGNGHGNNNSQTKTTQYTATINVIIIKSDEADKYKYLENEVDHIQINIEASAIILGYNEDGSTPIDLNFGSDTEYTLTKVTDDDSEVGYYYQLTYTNSNNVTTTITVRVDETQNYSVTPYFTIAGISIEEGNSSSGSTSDDQISFDGVFPVGTQAEPVKYVITVETTLELTPNNNSEAENVDVTLSDTIGYWDSDNECPGLDQQKDSWQKGSLISGSGIDLSKFSTGANDQGKTVYIIFSELTKIVKGYSFNGETKERNFIFTVYRRSNGTETWEPFDTITVTANSETTTTTLNTDASKYIGKIEGYEFKIEETGNSISGYDCSVSMRAEGNTTVEQSTNSIEFDWKKDENDSTIVYSVKLTCTNTYTQKRSGLTVKKVVNKENEADVLPQDDKFSVEIQPTSLTFEDNTAAYNAFNGKTYNYTISDENGNVTSNGSVNSSNNDNGFGTITVDIKAGQSINFSGLPIGRYTVHEIKGENSNYEYDLTSHDVEIEEGKESTVTITNTYKQQKKSLVITKQGVDQSDANQIFLFKITDNDNMKLTVSIKGNGSVTVDGLKVGGNYTVTEIADWSWSYELDTVTFNNVQQNLSENSVSVTLTTDTDTDTLIFTNKKDKDKWLSFEDSVDNIFTTATTQNTNS